MPKLKVGIYFTEFKIRRSYGCRFLLTWSVRGSDPYLVSKKRWEGIWFFYSGQTKAHAILCLEPTGISHVPRETSKEDNKI